MILENGTERFEFLILTSLVNITYTDSAGYEPNFEFSWLGFEGGERLTRLEDWLKDLSARILMIYWYLS
jgi:hypothetical protein